MQYHRFQVMAWLFLLLSFPIATGAGTGTIGLLPAIEEADREFSQVSHLRWVGTSPDQNEFFFFGIDGDGSWILQYRRLGAHNLTFVGSVALRGRLVGSDAGAEFLPLAFHPNQQFAYVRTSQGLELLRRNPATGAFEVFGLPIGVGGYAPFVSPDGRHLYLSSPGKRCTGGSSSSTTVELLSIDQVTGEPTFIASAHYDLTATYRPLSDSILHGTRGYYSFGSRGCADRDPFLLERQPTTGFVRELPFGRYGDLLEAFDLETSTAIDHASIAGSADGRYLYTITREWDQSGFGRVSGSSLRAFEQLSGRFVLRQNLPVPFCAENDIYSGVPLEILGITDTRLLLGCRPSKEPFRRVYQWAEYSRDTATGQLNLLSTGDLELNYASVFPVGPGEIAKFFVSPFGKDSYSGAPLQTDVAFFEFERLNSQQPRFISLHSVENSCRTFPMSNPRSPYVLIVPMGRDSRSCDAIASYEVDAEGSLTLRDYEAGLPFFPAGTQTETQVTDATFDAGGEFLFSIEVEGSLSRFFPRVVAYRFDRSTGQLTRLRERSILDHNSSALRSGIVGAQFFSGSSDSGVVGLIESDRPHLYRWNPAASNLEAVNDWLPDGNKLVSVRAATWSTEKRYFYIFGAEGFGNFQFSVIQVFRVTDEGAIEFVQSYSEGLPAPASGIERYSLTATAAGSRLYLIERKDFGGSWLYEMSIDHRSGKIGSLRPFELPSERVGLDLVLPASGEGGWLLFASESSYELTYLQLEGGVRASDPFLSFEGAPGTTMSIPRMAASDGRLYISFPGASSRMSHWRTDDQVLPVDTVPPATLTPSPPPGPTPTRPPCYGDCYGDGRITVDEILKLVAIALGSTRLTDCPSADANGDGQITVDELVLSVQGALQGCSSPAVR